MPNLLATDEADLMGNPLNTHQNIVPVGPVTVVQGTPASGRGALALVAIAMLGGAWFVLLRRQGL